MKGIKVNEMTNENKARLLRKFLIDYPFNFEGEYCKIRIQRLNTRDDNLYKIAEIFDEHQDYIIDYFTSEI